MEESIDVVGIRERLGWTQQQLADHCCVDRSTVSKWENDPPTKGPALILLRQLRDRAGATIPAGAASQAAGDDAGDSTAGSPAAAIARAVAGQHREAAE